MFDNYLDILSNQFNNYLRLKEKRPGIVQVFAPLYHADGDMMEIFFEELDHFRIRISDFGLTLMRLSYTYDVDGPTKTKVLERILSENGVSINAKGVLSIECNKDSIYPALMQFAQTISKVTNMRLFKREVIHSMFFEMLDDFVMTKLEKFHPQKTYYPLPGHDEYEVDYCINSRSRPIFLFGVNNNFNARLTTISCQKFIADKINFSSLVILEDLELLGKKDQNRLMSAADKQFPSLEDFMSHAEEYIERER